MAGSLYLRAAAVTLVVLHTVVAQQCYYPNGKPAPDTEKPCSSADATACCPDTWECMENGLCYLPADKLYGRYSCTDQSWNSTNCPSNMCTYDKQADGGEGITQCSNHDNKWCCDADRTNVDCCQESPKPRPFFALQDPKAYGTAGGSTGSSAPVLASITGEATGSGDDSPSSTAASNSASATKDSFSSGSSSSSSTASASVTSLSTTISSGTAGVITIITTNFLPAASSTGDASPSTNPEKKSNVGLIVGCAVGVPLGLALLGILIWLFRKRAQQKHAATPYTSSTDGFTPMPASPEFAGGAKFHSPTAAKYESTDPGVPELAGGQGVGPERPVSMIPGKAEMDSGGGFAPGTVPQAPHLVGVGGGHGSGYAHSSWGGAPPGYEPPQSHAAGAIADPHAGLYQAYRPGVPEMAELPTVQTPPEVAELGGPSPPAREGYPGLGDAGAHKR